jgi:hypothetical protein
MKRPEKSCEAVFPNGRESAEVLQLFDDSFDYLRASLRQ